MDCEKLAIRIRRDAQVPARRLRQARHRRADHRAGSPPGVGHGVRDGHQGQGGDRQGQEEASTLARGDADGRKPPRTVFAVRTKSRSFRLRGGVL